MKPAFFLFSFVLMLTGVNHASASDGIESVNIYMGHFLLQSWPKDKRAITMEVDTTFPPDTLVFQALAVKGGLKSATLEIRDLQGNVIEEVSRVTRLEDGTEATFIYVLNPANARKIRDRRFSVILNSHLGKEPEDHNVALILLNSKQ